MRQNFRSKVPGESQLANLTALDTIPSQEISSLNDRPFIVAAIPAYNEERTIAKLVLQAKKYSDKVVVCDDGSTDSTSEIATELGADVIRHEKNLGYGAAIRSLFRRARELGADVTVTLDGDGQHEPSEIPLLAQPILSGQADVVIGSRFLVPPQNGGMPRYRRVGIDVITKLASIASSLRLSDAQSGFRAYGIKALNELVLSEEGMSLSVEVLLETRRHNLEVVEVPSVCYYENPGKTSTQNPLRHGLGVLVSLLRLVVEEKPLMLLGVPGAALLLVGIGFGAWMLRIYTSEGHVVTNIALASIAFILIGLVAVFAAITLYSIGRLMKRATSLRS